MIVYVISVEATPKGVATNGFLVQNSDDPVERIVASMLDSGFKATTEFIAIESSKAGAERSTVLEGKKIEEYVSKGLKAIHAGDLRKAMKEGGYKIPE